MATENMKYNAYQFGILWVNADPFDDYVEMDTYTESFADDGWPRPGNCPVCGAPDWICVTDVHYTYTPEEIAYVTQVD